MQAGREVALDDEVKLGIVFPKIQNKIYAGKTLPLQNVLRDLRDPSIVICLK